MWHSRTFWRLFGTFGTLLLTSIGVLGTVIADRVERDYLRQVEETLRTKAILVREILRDRPADYPARLQEHFHRLRQETVTRITLLAPDGRVLADTDEDPAQMENHADRPEVRAAQEAGFGASVRYSHTLGQSMMYAALRAPADSGGVGYVRVALPLSDVRGQLAGLRRIVWTAAAVIGLAVLALAFWPARRLTRPLDELVRGAQRLVAGEHTRKIDLTAAGEVGTLARSFNALSDQLAAQVKQVEADRQQLRAVLGGMVEGVVALDADARILFMNGRAAELLDLAAPAAVGRKFWEMVRQPNLQDVVRQALAGPEPSRQELTWPGPVPRHLTVHASRLPGGPARGAVLVLHDTTELRRLERLRQEFVANVSHELKTPLAVIKASLETLLGGALADPEFGQRFLQRAVAQADRLNMLILDLLSLARIEAGDELFEFQAVALAPVVAECLERHRERAEGKRLTLEAVPPDTYAETAWADAEAVGQILDNLVDNALKYTPEGGRVRVRWRAEDGQVRLDVEDTGIGIPEQDLPRVFERFYRVDKARSRELGGTGLGLAIVKHLAHAMHGRVGVTSQVGQGTVFTVHLPRESES